MLRNRDDQKIARSFLPKHPNFLAFQERLETEPRSLTPEDFLSMARKATEAQSAWIERKSEKNPSVEKFYRQQNELIQLLEKAFASSSKPDDDEFVAAWKNVVKWDDKTKRLWGNAGMPFSAACLLIALYTSAPDFVLRQLHDRRYVALDLGGDVTSPDDRKMITFRERRERVKRERETSIAFPRPYSIQILREALLLWGSEQRAERCGVGSQPASFFFARTAAARAWYRHKSPLSDQWPSFNRGEYELLDGVAFEYFLEARKRIEHVHNSWDWRIIGRRAAGLVDGLVEGHFGADSKTLLEREQAHNWLSDTEELPTDTLIDEAPLIDPDEARHPVFRATFSWIKHLASKTLASDGFDEVSQTDMKTLEDEFRNGRWYDEKSAPFYEKIGGAGDIRWPGVFFYALVERLVPPEERVSCADKAVRRSLSEMLRFIDSSSNGESPGSFLGRSHSLHFSPMACVLYFGLGACSPETRLDVACDVMRVLRESQSFSHAKIKGGLGLNAEFFYDNTTSVWSWAKRLRSDASMVLGEKVAEQWLPLDLMEETRTRLGGVSPKATEAPSKRRARCIMFDSLDFRIREMTRGRPAQSDAAGTSNTERPAGNRRRKRKL